MGFGILFIGYFLTISFELDGISLPPAFPGYLIMAYACGKLNDYSVFFGKTRRFLYVLSVFSAVDFIVCLLSAGNILAADPVFYTAFGILKSGMSLFMHYLLLNALSEIASDVGRKKIAVKCKRNIYLTALLLAFSIAFPFIPFDEGYSYILKFIVSNIVIFLNSVQIFSCYMWICYEGDEDMDADNGMDPLSKLLSKSRKEYSEYRLEKEKQKKNRKKK